MTDTQSRSKPITGRVKSLIWNKETTAYRALTPIGEYRAANIHGIWMWFFAWMPESTEDKIDKGRGNRNTLKAAKAAAQADYDARILSAIESAPAVETAHLRTLLARVLFMDCGSAEDALEYLGGMAVAMDLYHAAMPEVGE